MIRAEGDGDERDHHGGDQAPTAADGERRDVDVDGGDRAPAAVRPPGEEGARRDDGEGDQQGDGRSDGVVGTADGGDGHQAGNGG